MPVVLAPLLAGFAIIVGALVLYGMHAGADAWLRPLLKAIPDKQSFAGKLFRLTPVFGIAKGIGWVFGKVRHDVSHALVARLAPLASWLTALGTRTLLHNNALVGLAEDTVRAFSYLRHHAIPMLIHRAVAPVAHLARTAERDARRSISLVHKAERDFTRGIDRLAHRLEAEIARRVHGIDRLLRDTVLPRLRTAEREIAGVITRDLPRIRAREKALERTLRGEARRLSRLEKLLGLGVITALLIRTLARVAPWLFCRNWKRVGRSVCSMDSLLLDALLLDLGLLATPFSIEQFARLMQTPTRELMGGLDFLVTEVGQFATVAEGVWTKGATADPVPDL